jgi:hypothetical protein
MPFWAGLALFIVVDVMVVYVVLKRVLAQRLGQTGAGAGGLPGLAGLARFASEAAAETKSYLGANYSGDPSSLAMVMQGLVDRLAQRANERGMALDRGVIKQFAATAVISLKAAKAQDVRAAIESVS